MGTWVEDIVQALTNLGGQATLAQIYDEVKKIRIEPLPVTYKSSIRGRIEDYSSDSSCFKGKDYFRKVGEGVWALRDSILKENQTQASKDGNKFVISENINQKSYDLNLKDNNMERNTLIQDTGLFSGQKVFEFSLTESFESITNLFQTIKEYREFANPNEADTWFEYIHQFFQIFGFNTIKVSPRLITLQEMGVNQIPKALVCIVGPNEDFAQIIFGLDWESYLFYAAKYHQVEWVILTNGLQFKVLNCADNADQQKYFQCELDEIIKSGKTDSFFTLYKIMSIINHYKDTKITTKGNGAEIKGPKGRVIRESHLIRKEFWKQLLSRSKGKTTLFDKKSPGIEHYFGISGGKAGINLNYIIATNYSRVEMYIDKGNVNFNKRVFDSLFSHKEEIESLFGDALVWDRHDDKRACTIRYTLGQIGIDEKDKWPEIQDQMIDAMIRFEKAFRDAIKDIPK